MRRVVIACLLLGACARGPSARSPSPAVAEPASAAPPVVSCARRTGGVRPVRVSGARQGSAVALARAGDRLLAYVADADSRSLHTIDVDARRELVRTRVDGEPRQLLVLADGRVVATLSDGARIAVLEPAADPSAPLAPSVHARRRRRALGRRRSRPTTRSSWSRARWGSALTVLDAATFDVRRVVPLPRDPRGVLVTTTASRSSAHLVGAKMSAVDLSARTTTRRPSTSPSTSRRRARSSTTCSRCAPGSQGYALASIALPAKGRRDRTRARPDADGERGSGRPRSGARRSTTALPSTACPSRRRW